MRRVESRFSVLVPAAFGMAMMCSAASGEEVAGTDSKAPAVVAETAIDAGRYLVVLGGCNDCHTAGWMESGGNIAETDWLKGTPVGWRGPWGTTYSSNLRLLVTDLDEEAWVVMLRTRKDRPPMPWMNLNRLSEADARALYVFIKSLGNAGTRVPAYVPPGVEPATPYLLMEPQHMERLTAPAAAPPPGE